MKETGSYTCLLYEACFLGTLHTIGQIIVDICLHIMLKCLIFHRPIPMCMKVFWRGNSAYKDKRLMVLPKSNVTLPSSKPLIMIPRLKVV